MYCARLNDGMLPSSMTRVNLSPTTSFADMRYDPRCVASVRSESHLCDLARTSCIFQPIAVLRPTLFVLPDTFPRSPLFNHVTPPFRRAFEDAFEDRSNASPPLRSSSSVAATTAAATTRFY